MELAFTSKLPYGFAPGNSLKAVVNADNYNAWFAITFQNTNQILVDKHQEPTGTVAFQIQIRLDENIAVLNSCVNGAWCDEERHDLGYIDSNKKIKVKISSTDEGFEVDLNGKHFADFKHRENASDISHVNVYGDVVILKFRARAE